MTWEIREGDCLDVMLGIPAESVDAIVTDPPYGLGFMGKDWDHGVPGMPFWEDIRRVAKPGAWLFAFGGSRTYHRLACGIEDAGWEVRDSLCWLYGQGFPKSLNGPWGGTALKPAWEPIIVARKPPIGTVAKNFERFGTAGLNIDACRLPVKPGEGDDVRLGGRGVWSTEKAAKNVYEGGYAGELHASSTGGRWPANVALDEEAARLLDEQGGRRGGAGPVLGTEPSETGQSGIYGRFARVPGVFHADAGGASRFFYCAKASRAEREEGCQDLPARTGAEAVDRKEGTAGLDSPRAGAGRTASHVRNHHPTAKPIALMRWLCRLATPPKGLILDPFAGSGSTGCAAIYEGFRFIGIEKEADYCEIAKARLTHWQTVEPETPFLPFT